MPNKPQWETVAIPFASGIKPSFRARLLDAVKLLRADNVYFDLDQGPSKRLGHTARPVRTGDNFPAPPSVPLTPTGHIAVRDTYSTQDPGLSPSWLYGWGIWADDTAPDFKSPNTDPYEVSTFPDAGYLFGATTRDSEVVAWDGHRLFSHADRQAGGLFGEPRGQACMPALRNQTLAKVSTSQIVPDGADNGVLRAVAWLNADNTSSYSAYDSRTGACLVPDSRFTHQTPVTVRIIPVGEWFHVLVSDTGTGELHMRSFHQDSPGVATVRNLGPCGKVFDVKKQSEAEFVVMKASAGVITAVRLRSDGGTITSAVLDLSGHPVGADRAFAFEFDRFGFIGLAWQDASAPANVYFTNYSSGFVARIFSGPVTTVAAPSRMTIAPKFVLPTNELTEGDLPESAWEIWVEDTVGGTKQVRVHFWVNGSQNATITRHKMALASHAFRVGNRTFAWCTPWKDGTGNPVLQATWFLMDAGLRPVGKMDYGQAAADLGDTRRTLHSVNWHVDAATHPYKDRVVYHGALPYNQRVDVAQTLEAPSKFTPNGVFSETSIHFYELDFLPPLRAGQAGRTTHFAGAQLWAYDGVTLTEAGFHMAPEGVSYGPGAGGSLSAGEYRVRVDLCHRNAQNEEVRSWSLIGPASTAVAGQKLVIAIPTMPFTRRDDSYFLVFVTEANGSIYYLASSRDPASASFVKNDQGISFRVFNHTIADSDLRRREQHPGNVGGNYLDPLPAPACEVVAAGRDRLWLAGGELAPGEVAPSRLFVPGETPAFSPGLNVLVDRGAEPVTAIGFVGEIAAIFRRTSTYTLVGDGPDNVLNGAWAQPRLTIADTGAVGPEGLVLSAVGLWFQAPAGLRLINAAGNMDASAGTDMDPLVAGARFCGAFSVPQFTQIRWYSRDPAKPSVVYSYANDSWCTWTGVDGVGAVFWPESDLGVVAKPEGRLWLETPDTYRDDGATYESVVRTAWLHAGQLGDFQRVRRFALLGQAAGGFTLSTRLYYNEREFAEEVLTDVFPLTDSVWGGGTWGSGPWGDSGNPLGSSLWFRDGVFRLRHRPRRQKCSVISLEFSDGGADVAGFAPVALALELGPKSGLDRIGA